MWKAHFDNISHDDAAALNAFGLWYYEGAPYYIRVDSNSPTAWLKQFRAIYVPKEPTARYYTLSFKQWIAGDDEDDPIVTFPADSFDAEDFPGAIQTGISTPYIHNNSNDDEPHYFDLQGRKLTAPAAKGVYIKDGKKVIK